LQTSTVASKEVKLEFQVEGLSQIQDKYITIYPDVPLKVDLSFSRSKIQASPDDSTFLYAVLKDRYDNEIFNDSSTVLNLEVPDTYKHIITSNTLQQTVKEGKAQFKLEGTDIP